MSDDASGNLRPVILPVVLLIIATLISIWAVWADRPSVDDAKMIRVLTNMQASMLQEEDLQDPEVMEAILDINQKMRRVSERSSARQRRIGFALIVSVVAFAITVFSIALRVRFETGGRAMQGGDV